MNRINPIAIVILLVMLLFVLIYMLELKKDVLSEQTQAYKTAKTVALELSALENVYSHRKNVKSSLQRILAHESLQSTTLDTRFKKRSLTLAAQSIDAEALNILMGKLLNAAFIIESLKVSSVNETKA